MECASLLKTYRRVGPRTIQEGHTRRRGHRGGRAQDYTGGPYIEEEEEVEEDEEEGGRRRSRRKNLRTTHRGSGKNVICS